MPFADIAFSTVLDVTASEKISDSCNLFLNKDLKMVPVHFSRRDFGNYNLFFWNANPRT